MADLRVIQHDEATKSLAHLLSILEHAAAALDDAGADVDAAYVRAHAAQLARGREWPGDRITSTLDPDPLKERQNA